MVRWFSRGQLAKEDSTKPLDGSDSQVATCDSATSLDRTGPAASAGRGAPEHATQRSSHVSSQAAARQPSNSSRRAILLLNETSKLLRSQSEALAASAGDEDLEAEVVSSQEAAAAVQRFLSRKLSRNTSRSAREPTAQPQGSSDPQTAEGGLRKEDTLPGEGSTAAGMAEAGGEPSAAEPTAQACTHTSGKAPEAAADSTTEQVEQEVGGLQLGDLRSSGGAEDVHLALAPNMGALEAGHKTPGGGT